MDTNKGHANARVIAEVAIAAPVERVWEALRDPRQVRRWFGWDYEGIEAEIDEIFGERATADDDEHELRFADGDRYRLRPLQGGTLVQVTRAALGDGPGPDGGYDEIDEGWLTFTQQLRFLLERHDGQDRRTLFLDGAARSPAAFPPADALGIDALASVLPGDLYRTATALGEELGGEVWFRSDNQLGVTVDGWGDALLILLAVPPGARSEHGGAQLVVTTYGLPGVAFLELRERWEAWWSQRYG